MRKADTMSTPVLIPHCKCHTGIVKALVVHPVCQHCYLCNAVQSQVELELVDAAIHQLPYLHTEMPGLKRANSVLPFVMPVKNYSLIRRHILKIMSAQPLHSL